MSARAELRSYLEQLARRLRTSALLRGAAVLTASALIATVVLVALANRFGFSPASVWSARGVLSLAIIASAAFGLALPLWRLTRHRSAERAEQEFPEFGQRLLTFAERDREGEPFLELLAADTLRLARSASPKHMVPDAVLALLGGVAIASLAALIWLVRAGPGYWGYGAAALWTGTPSAPPYAIRVVPGDAAVRRGGDQLVVAEPLGLQPSQVRLHARFGHASRWESVAMEPQPRGSGYEFLLAGIPADVEYYVDAGRVTSRHYRLRVADVPAVKRIRVRLHYPAWTKLADETSDRGGDVRAVAGTEASIDVTTDRPLANGALVLDDGQQIALTGTAAVQGSTRDRHYQGTIRIARDGAYHIAARIAGKAVRISEDYFIEASEVKPPQVAILRPAGDYHASPIEEVTVGTTASDAFGLNSLILHYSLNGSAERTVSLLPAAGAKQASGTAVISLEALKASPGDVVSLYASAKDARTESRTDIAFIQVDPFEREFSQSQQAGGGGGGFGSGQAQIAEREKEIISATWKQSGLESPPPRQATEQAKFLSEAQGTLRSQSQALAGRVELRDLTSGNEAIQRFQQEMSAAAEAMEPAARLLGGEHWRHALQPEQKALEHLLRAEATFRQIQVAFGSVGAGGGGGSAGRDLASLFDLELDRQKNSYETRQDAQSRSGRADQLDDVLHRLDEVARRQQALAAAGNAANTAEQRWQEEMLRREADELRKQVEQLARNAAGANGASGSPSGQAANGASGASGASGANGANGANAASAAAAAQRLREAEADMRRAVDERDAAGARSAAERLQEALAQLGGVKQQESESQLDALSREAGRLADEEHRQAMRLRAAAGTAGGGEAGVAGALGSGGPFGSRGLPGRAGSQYPGRLPGFGPGSRSGRGSDRGTLGAPGSGDLQSLIEERQKLADDLSRLESAMRSAERETLPRSRAAASKLRDALNDLDQSDTETQLQRSADLMRRGFVNQDESGEGDIESSLRHLADQIGEAGTALARGASSSNDEALASVERLRDRIAAIRQGMQPGGRAGGAQGNGEGGAQSGSTPGRGAPGNAQRGAAAGVNGGLVGPVTAGGGGRPDFVNGGWDAGVDPGLRGRGTAAGIARGSPGTFLGVDPEQNFRQSLGDLDALRRAVGDDPQSRREVDELIRAMRQLDPRRFPGNPAMVEELYGRVLSEVDRLQVELSRAAQGPDSNAVRSDRPLNVPPGYQQAVADYYRRLSQAAR
ncbi:MAG TPA: hypothetical protein VN730_10940 [Steroidobacteraceae bacterium]|nr:hypothetical protein [Steroidobacteraceae bacterium]